MDFKNMLHQIGQLYQNLSKKQRIVIAASIVVVVGFLVFLSLYRGSGGSSTGYEILVDNIDPSSSSAIVSKLEQNGVPYILENEKTILVPKDQLYKQKMMIASEGLIKDNRVGFELFDQQSFGATSKEQEIKYQRAIEGELARTIETLEPIEKAYVHIAFPKESVFVSKQIPPTASVVVNIKEGLRLTRKQIDGIKSIVSASIPKLTKENVKISDQKGIPLDDQELYDTDLINTEIKYKRDHERELEEKIVNTLAPFAGGSDKIEVNVNMEFDFSKKESQSEYYDPNAVVIRSEQTLNEEKQGLKDKETKGVPGAVSNIGPVEGLDGKEQTEFYKKNQVTTNNEVSKTITNTKKQFATLLRTSVAVAIDGKYKEILDENGDIKSEYVPLSEIELKNIESLVQSAINYDKARGDLVTVRNLQFHKESVKVESKVKTLYSRFVEPFIPPVKYFIAAIFLFIFYKKVIVPFTQKMLEDVNTQDEVQEGQGALIDDAEDALEKMQAARKKVEEQLGLGENFNEDSIQYEILLEKLRSLVSDKGEEIAALLQNLVQNDSEFSEKDI